MTIIVFLIDTSASMFQRTYVGGRTTLLDVAKSAVETFVKIRQRSVDSRIDRYMLLTFEDPPNNIKAGWKENLATFMNELKNLQCCTMTTMGVAVKQSFDILNINRMTSGIDTYGQGRCPFFLETSVIVLITDGGKLSTSTGIQEEFNLPMNSIPGSEMTREPFRWDQRLFALVLRLTGTPAVERDTGLVPSDGSPIDAMCEVTGGRSYCITSHRMLNQCIDSLVQKVQNGVVINFEKIGPDPPAIIEKVEDSKDDITIIKEENDTSGSDKSLTPLQTPLNTNWYNCRKMIYVARQTPQKGYPLGFWPIPESFWPELTASALPPRSAHPNVKFTCSSSDPMVIENLPFDKYELEPSPLTQFILARKQPTVCWQVFVANSYKNSDVGHPFGYLKASTNLNCVNLFVMPYNYPVLLPLLEELYKVHRCKPTNEWRTQFQNYMRTLPAYYIGPLRRALTRMGTPLALAQTLIPENAENCLSYAVNNYIKRLKTQAKVEYERLCSDIIQRQANSLKNQLYAPEQIKVFPKITLKKDLISHPLLVDKFNAQKEQILELGTPFISTIDKERQTVSYRNPFDIPRNRLMHQVARMRNNFYQADWVVFDQDATHSLPISQMGNYQEYLKRQTPQLREIESTPVRQHMFGNPFKIDKRMMVDEADIDLVGSGSPGANRPNKRPNPSNDVGGRLPLKRKPGPLPKDLIIRRPSGDYSPPPSPALSNTMVMAPMSPVMWQSPVDVEVSNLESKPVHNNGSISNGIESVTNERSRSPSPTQDVQFFVEQPVRNTLTQNHVSGESVVLNIVENNVITEEKPQLLPIPKENIVIVNNVNNKEQSKKSLELQTAPIIAEVVEEVDLQNLEIRRTLNKLVRRPGKNFSELFDNIKTLKGNVEVQVAVVRHVISESLRFKRKHLANLLEEHVQNLLSAENK